MKKKIKNVAAVVICSLVLFSMNGCLRANSTEKEITDTTASTTTAASTDSTADSTASSDTTASTDKKDSAASSADAGTNKTDTTAAADKKDSANSGDAKAESTDSAAADSTAAAPADSTPANQEAENSTDSTAQTAESTDGTDSANVVGEIDTPNAEGVTLKITTKDGNIDLEQGDKWSVSYDGGAAEDLNMKEPVDINEETRSVKVTYPKDAVFYTLEVSATGKGSINSNGILSGNCYLGTESGSVNFASSAPLEEYNLFVSSASGKASVNGEDASGADGYNNIGTTEKMVIVSSNTGDVTLTFNQ